MEGLRLLGGFDNADSMDVGGDNLKPWAIFASPVGSDGVPTRAAALMEAGASGSELNGRYGEMVAFSTFGERENYDVDNAYAYEWLESEYGDLGAYQEDGRCHLDWDKVAEDFGSITLTPKGFREIVVEGGKVGMGVSRDGDTGSDGHRQGRGDGGALRVRRRRVGSVRRRERGGRWRWAGQNRRGRGGRRRRSDRRRIGRDRRRGSGRDAGRGSHRG